jgi:hypothetical protein
MGKNAVCITRAVGSKGVVWGVFIKTRKTRRSALSPTVSVKETRIVMPDLKGNRIAPKVVSPEAREFSLATRSVWSPVMI